VALVAPESPVVQVALVAPENPVVQVALVVPENPAVQELETGPVVALELVINLVAAEREPDPVAALLKIKSVTGPRRHDPAAALRVEDLAVAVAETTREPAATEAAKAWAAAE
jgi:hypothetical protein